jgi:hypothetical protein
LKVVRKREYMPNDSMRIPGPASTTEDVPNHFKLISRDRRKRRDSKRVEARSCPHAQDSMHARISAFTTMDVPLTANDATIEVKTTYKGNQ